MIFWRAFTKDSEGNKDYNRISFEYGIVLRFPYSAKITSVAPIRP